MVQPIGVAVSELCAPLLDGPRRDLVVVHRSRLAWQLADEHGGAVCSVLLPGAVRLPVAIALSQPLDAPDEISVGAGDVVVSGRRLPVTRWWRPARPRLPGLAARLDRRGLADLARRVPTLVGSGPGLTPYGDDVLCGALVAAHAADPGAADVLAGALAAVDVDRRTTATSALVLRSARQGWCIDEVAAYLAALATGSALDAARAALLQVGHTSGAGLVAGIHRVVQVGEIEAAA